MKSSIFSSSQPFLYPYPSSSFFSTQSLGMRNKSNMGARMEPRTRSTQRGHSTSNAFRAVKRNKQVQVYGETIEWISPIVSTKLQTLYAFPIFLVSSNILTSLIVHCFHGESIFFGQTDYPKEGFWNLYFPAVYTKFLDIFFPQTVFTYCIDLSAPLYT